MYKMWSTSILEGWSVERSLKWSILLLGVGKINEDCKTLNVTTHLLIT